MYRELTIGAIGKYVRAFCSLLPFHLISVSPRLGRRGRHRSFSSPATSMIRWVTFSESSQVLTVCIDGGRAKHRCSSSSRQVLTVGNENRDYGVCWPFLLLSCDDTDVPPRRSLRYETRIESCLHDTAPSPQAATGKTARSSTRPL